MVCYVVDYYTLAIWGYRSRKIDLLVAYLD